jgi:hypothetical protein
MSFRCGNCNGKVEHGEKQIKRVTKIREKNYLGGGQGHEIAKELLIGKCCKDRVPMAPERIAF